MSERGAVGVSSPACTSRSSARATSAGRRWRRRCSPIRSASAAWPTRCGSPAREPAAGMPARAPTIARTGCCANTAIRRSTGRAQIDDDHLSADLVVALGRNHERMLREHGCRAEPAADAAVVRPALGCARARRRGPLLRHARRLRGRLRRHRGRAARVCTTGWTSSWPAAESPADEAMVLPAAAAAGSRCSSWSSRSPTCASPCWRRGSSARTPRRPARTRRSPGR